MRVIGLAVVLALSLAAPLAAEAQPAARVFRIGVLGPAPVVPSNDEAFKQGLAQFGYKDGQNLVIEYRHAEGSRLSARKLKDRVIDA